MRSAAHAHDELGISEMTTARPIQAALTSAATFSVGAAMPLLMVLVSPASMLVLAASVASLLFLALLGAIGASAGGANTSSRNATRPLLGRFRYGAHRRHRRAGRLGRVNQLSGLQSHFGGNPALRCQNV